MIDSNCHSIIIKAISSDRCVVQKVVIDEVYSEGERRPKFSFQEQIKDTVNKRDEEKKKVGYYSSFDPYQFVDMPPKEALKNHQKHLIKLRKGTINYSTKINNIYPYYSVLCECGQLVSHEDMYTCVKCQDSYCLTCVHKDPQATFCLRCSEVSSLNSVANSFFACTKCLECPNCYNSVNFTNVEIEGTKFFVIECNFCMWNSKEMGMWGTLFEHIFYPAKECLKKNLEE